MVQSILLQPIAFRRQEKHCLRNAVLKEAMGGTAIIRTPPPAPSPQAGRGE